MQFHKYPKMSETTVYPSMLWFASMGAMYRFTVMEKRLKSRKELTSQPFLIIHRGLAEKNTKYINSNAN